MSMPGLLQPQFPYTPEALPTATPPVAQAVDLPTLTTIFLDSAAALESRLRESERSNQVLREKVRRAQKDQARARTWIVMLRRSHRRASHATTSRLFRKALDELDYLAASEAGSTRT